MKLPDSRPAYPGYKSLLAEGRLDAVVAAAFRHLEACDLCPRRCGVARTRGELGFCQGGLLARVASEGPHFGEEACLVGRHGSGTIFLAGCSLGCAFCQNYDISRMRSGREVSARELAGMMLGLQESGCHNINLVTPTHFTPQILEAVALAARDGLDLPLVWNCGGYEALSMLELLEGAVDIYMPDFKFWSGVSSERYCGVGDYPAAAREAMKEMHRQVGDLVIERGLAARGLLVRHLVMPGAGSETSAILEFLARDISRGTFVNVMDQYRPCYQADRFPEIARRPEERELAAALDAARRAGLTRICT